MTRGFAAGLRVLAALAVIGCDPAPVNPVGLTAGDHHTCARLDSGLLRCWGSAPSGELGYGNSDSIGDDETPGSAGDVPVGVNVLQVSAGNAHTCVLTDQNAVRCWGEGSLGRLGYANTLDLGDDEPASAAADIALGSSATAVTAGGQHTCALTSDGRVRCWGWGGLGQLGYGNTEAIGDNETPASVGFVELNDVAEGPASSGLSKQVTAGASHTCALVGSAVYCWGEAVSGALGYGNENNVGDNETPASVGPVSVGGDVVAVTAGHAHTCALLMGGGVRCWGTGADGRLGYGNTNDVGRFDTPASVGDVALGGAAVQIAAGTFHTCALLADGGVKCWGRGTNGALGYGNRQHIGDDELPSSVGTVPIGGIATSIAVGANHTCALLETGDLTCWGSGGPHLGRASNTTIGDDEVPSSVPFVGIDG